MKVIIPGGSGQVGALIARWFGARGDDVIVLSRKGHAAAEPVRAKAQPTVRGGRSAAIRVVAWDGKTLGSWADEIDGADVVINLAGRSVNCRYTEENLRQMMDSRVDSTRVIGQAIAKATSPPPVWLQMSTATIYAHTTDGPANDEDSGIIGGCEPNVPAYWKRSIDIATAWEKTLHEADTPNTRKVILRTAMVMTPDKDGIFDVICGLTRKGLGGTIAGGKQWVSWIHGSDFCRAIDLLIERDDLEGIINMCAPNPPPQAEQMKILRDALGIKIGLPAAAWMSRLGAVFMRTDAELVLKSRRVVPGRLLEEGFAFHYPTWQSAVEQLVEERRVAA